MKEIRRGKEQKGVLKKRPVKKETKTKGGFQKVSFRCLDRKGSREVKCWCIHLQRRNTDTLGD